MRGLTKSVLDRLDEVIEEYELHARGGREPVSLARVVEKYWAGYRDLPEGVEAVAMQWQRGGVKFAKIALDCELAEPEERARKAHALGHEFGHIALRHRGTWFLLWRGEDAEADAFEHYVERSQERECELVAAYLLVPREVGGKGRSA